MSGSPDAAREFVIRLLLLGGNRTSHSHIEAPTPKRNDWVADAAVDWELVWEVAASERVAPLLYRATRGVDSIPEWWRERCRAAYHETGILNTLRLQELKTLLSDFRTAGLDVILLKGAALIELVYGNPALRPMVDLDFLVRREDVDVALAVFDRREYRKSGNEIARGSTLAYENEALLQKESPYGWQVELHWHLFDSPYYQRRLSESEWWRTAVAMTVEGEDALCLSPEWTIIHLCGHLIFHHQGRGLLWWNDLADLVRLKKDDIHWDYVVTQAQAARMVLPLRNIIPVLATTWRAPISEEVTNRLQSIAPEQEEVELFQAMTGYRFSPGHRLLVDVKGLGSRREKARFLMHNVFPSTAYMDARYGIRHPAARPFYYVYRWFLGLRGMVRDSLRSGRGDR